MDHGSQLYVDTGGTFTDCLAVDADGRERRVKVLSSAALRGRVVEALGERRLRIAAAWDGPDQLVRGFGFRLLDRDDVDAHYYLAMACRAGGDRRRARRVLRQCRELDEQNKWAAETDRALRAL